MPVHNTPSNVAAIHEAAGIGVAGHVAIANGAAINVAQLKVPATPTTGGRSASQCRVRFSEKP